MIGIKLPSFDESNQTAAEMAISLLVREWPLTAKKIYNRIRQEHRTGVTYQAVYKSLNQLFEEGILIKHGNEYSINLKWIEKIHDFINNVRKNYLSKTELLIPNAPNIVKSGNASIMTFDTIKDADIFIVNFERKTNKIAIGHARHFWWALFYLKNTFDKNSISLNKKTYGLCRGNTALDKWCVEFENSIGISSKCAVNVASDCDLYVYDDYVIQVFIPLELVKKIDTVFKNAKKILDINFKKLFNEIYEKKIIVHTHSPTLSSREELLHREKARH